MTGIPVPDISLPVDPSLVPMQSTQDNNDNSNHNQDPKLVITTLNTTGIQSSSQNSLEGGNYEAPGTSTGPRKKKNNRKKSKGANKSLPTSTSVGGDFPIAQGDNQPTIPGATKKIDITDVAADNTAGVESRSRDAKVVSADLVDLGSLEGNDSVNSRDTDSTGDLERPAAAREDIDTPKASPSSASASVEDPNHPEELSPMTKPSETTTLTSATEPTPHETSTTETVGVPRPTSPSTASSRSVPITPTSPSHGNLDYSPSTIFPHGYSLYQDDEKQHTSFPSHTNFTNIPNPSPPHPTIHNQSGLLETITSHHYLPHHDTTIPLSQQTISPGDPIPPPPKPTTPTPPLHAPGPGVTVGRIVMQVAPPISPYLTHPPLDLELQSHPPGYTQNPYAAELPPWIHSQSHPYSQRYNSLASKNNDNDYEEKDEGFGGIFGQSTSPLGTSVNTKGYHRRGREEDVGLVAGLMNMWEKGVDWLQDWMESRDENGSRNGNVRG